ncbi:von Willebrand factor D and EGF domain-containing protein-like [Ptychodera flava]|uniref:von Willebrand factor D and EGF domain-containing protein-like n=1 Tax=Ptychodera flava TaxID=63121 RepID=UPI003969BFF7
MNCKTVLVLIAVLAVATIPTSAIADPCYSHIEIDEPERSVNYMVDQSLPAVTYLCDDNLLGYQWYRFVSGAGGQMSTRDDLPQYACGTRYPLYMVGDHPTEINETILTSACNSRFNDPCFDEYDIEVKKCDGYFVYRLESVNCPSAYCAGTEVRCPEGQNSPTGFTPGCNDEYPRINDGPDVNISIESKDYGGVFGEQMTPVLSCSFKSDSNNDQSRFNVSWYVDNNFVLLETLDTTDGNDEIYTSRMDQFTHPFANNEGLYSLGQNIRCSVTTYFLYAEVISPEKNSANFFAGITVHNRTVYIDENADDPVPIEFSSSVPIECDKTVQSENCIFEVGLQVDKTVRRKVKTGIKHCNITLGIDYEIDSIFSLEVVSQPTEPNDDSDQYVLEFSANKNSAPSYFRDYRPEHVVVHRKGKKSSICSSTGDPHYTTFDGSRYDWYGTGDYVMVREKVGKSRSKFSNFEVHVRLKHCTENAWNPSCNCAVAVREGNDVAIADGCNLNHGFTIARITNPDDCDPGFVASTSPDGREFRVSTPSGQLVRFEGSRYFNIYIEVNGLMEDRVEGLCGSFNRIKEDDFDYFDIEKNTPDTDRCEPLPPGLCCSCIPEKFSKSFKLPKGTSLFYTDHFKPSQYTMRGFYPMCQCLPEEADKPSAGSTIYCQESFAAPMLKILGNNGVPKYETQCNDLRKKRGGQDALYSDEDEYDPYAYEIHDDDFTFNPDNFTWPTPSGITQDDARAKCTEAIYQSNVAARCQEIDEAREATDVALEDCLFDILLMDDLKVVDIARSTVESVCLSTLTKNTSLWETNEEGELAPPASIINAVCPNNCNGNGNCTMNGTCVCKEGYTAVDCGIEIGKPPDVEYIRSGSLCDTRKRPCERVTVAAIGLLNADSLTCHIHDLKYDSASNSWVESGTVVQSAAQFASAYSAYCFLPLPRVRRQVRSLDEVGQSVQAQRISLSNDGVTESKPLFVMTYDSLCLNCSDSGTCVLKDDACLISGKCYAANETSPFDQCLQCQLDVANDEWTVITEGACAESTSMPSVSDHSTTTLHWMQPIEYSNDWMIPTVVTVSICVFILAVVVITTSVYWYKKKERLSSKIDAVSFQQSPQHPVPQKPYTAWAEPK